MVNRANDDKLPANHALRIAAQEFDEINDLYYSVPQQISETDYIIKKQAIEQLWEDYTGDDSL
jgi:uncharacterized protein (DUF2267 family)